MNLESWKAEYLAFWHIPPEEAEEAWKAKLDLEFGPRRKAPLAFVQKDVCYDSPIDGRPITSRQARIEDMKRANCIEYDPEMKTDYEARRRDSERKLDAAVEAHVEKAVHQMPSRKREKLASELLGGMDAEVVRSSTNISTKVDPHG